MKRPDRVDPRAIARAILASALAVAIASPATARAQAAATSDGHALAAGPIHDRHEIMEGMGLSAKAIGAALKSGKPADAAKPAEDIAGKVDAFLRLFPDGSTGHGSRAKPAIWAERAKFDSLGAGLKVKATAVADAAKSGGDVKAASNAMFGNCKSCHDQFREPEPGE